MNNKKLKSMIPDLMSTYMGRKYLMALATPVTESNWCGKIEVIIVHAQEEGSYSVCQKVYCGNFYSKAKSTSNSKSDQDKSLAY